MARAKVYHRICNVCHIDKSVSEYPKYSTKCNECITGRAKGKEIVCAECGKVGKLCARGLCNTCYSRWVKGRKIVECIDCHETKPHCSHGRCYACAERIKYYENREKILGQQHEWYLRNVEKEKGREKERYKRRKDSGETKMRSHLFYERHPERVREQAKRFHKNNPHKATQYAHQYRARKARLPSTLTIEEWEDKLREANGECYYCKEQTESFHKEHKQPASKGGGYTKENIVPACGHCNSSKGNKTEAEFWEYLIVIAEEKKEPLTMSGSLICKVVTVTLGCRNSRLP